MKNTLLTLFILLLNQINAQVINFPDSSFKSRLVSSSVTNTSSIAKDVNGSSIKVDINNDGEIEVSEALLVYEIRTNNIMFPINDFTGISNFQNLRKYRLAGDVNPSPTVFLDFTGLVNLERIECNNTGIQSLTVAGLTNLKELYCKNNNLQSLNLTGLTSLENLDCGGNDITTIDSSDAINLITLYCGDNLINSLTATSAVFLWCDVNYLTSLDVSNISNLIWLRCQNNQLSTLLFNNNTNLKTIDCSFNNLTSVDFSSASIVESIFCNGNDLANLNITGLNGLKLFSCFGNELTTIDFTGTNNIEKIDCLQNQITEIDLSNLTSLQFINIAENNLTTLNLNGQIQLNQIQCSYNNLSTLYLKNVAYNGLTATNDFLSFGNNPNLFYICTDESKIPLVQNIVNSYGYTNCVVDAACTLSSSYFDMEPEITLFPNPASSTLNINAKLKIVSVAIYNTLGQLVFNSSDKINNNNIDVSSLKSGNYFLKMNSTIGTKTERFIKE